MSKLITRSQYLADSKNLHHAYYSQFATDRLISVLRSKIERGELDLAVYASDKKCEWASDRKIKADYFGNIVLSGPDHLGVDLKPVGDYLTVAGAVCIAKAAVDILLLESEK